ncbi:MAG: hypothetical protein JSW27_01295, partial [Phycisphaerales bacterium]
ASRIFWLGAGLSFILMGLVLVPIARQGWQAGEIARDIAVFVPIARQGWQAGEIARDIAVFVVSFLFWLMIAVAAANRSGKIARWYWRLLCVLGYAFVSTGLAWISWGLRSRGGLSVMGIVPLGVMKFAACMLPAHYWHRFTAVPETKRAWLFLGALACGTILFWVVSQYGYDVHVGLRRWLMARAVR